MPDVQTDLRIHYRVVGDGPAVLWHNGGCGDGTMWEAGGYLRALPGYTHVLLDHRGRGSSEGPADLDGHRMADYVADALAVLDDAGITRAAFVGYSFGAHVGFALAQEAPERVAGLVALDSYPDRHPEPGSMDDGIQRILDHGTRALIEEYADTELEPTPAWLLDHLSATSSLAFAGALQAMDTAPDLWANAASVQTAVLLVLGVGHGPEPEGEDLVALLPDARLVELDVAHLAAFHRVDLTSPVIGQFLESALR